MNKKQPAVLTLMDGTKIHEQPNTTLEMGVSAVTLYNVAELTGLARVPNIVHRILRKYPKPPKQKVNVPIVTIPWHEIRSIDWGYVSTKKEEKPVSTRPAGAGRP